MKRKAETDPSAVLDAYFRERNMQGEAESAVAEQILQRAEDARDNFKSMRSAALDADVKPSELSPGEKYNRRLDNNRNSAAASRVYKEVLQKETNFTLRDVTRRADMYKKQVDELKANAERRQREDEEMRATITRLEAQLAESATASPCKLQDANVVFDQPLVPAHSSSLPPLCPTDTALSSLPSLSISSLPNSLSAKFGSRGELVQTQRGDVAASETPERGEEQQLASLSDEAEVQKTSSDLLKDDKLPDKSHESQILSD